MLEDPLNDLILKDVLQSSAPAMRDSPRCSKSCPPGSALAALLGTALMRDRLVSSRIVEHGCVVMSETNTFRWACSVSSSARNIRNSTHVRARPPPSLRVRISAELNASMGWQTWTP